LHAILRVTGCRPVGLPLIRPFRHVPPGLVPDALHQSP
jgi:hypothetical protein